MAAATPIYDLCALPPSDVALDVVATSIDGGRSMSGITQAIDVSGGGYVAVSYGGIRLIDPATHLAWNALAGWLSGSVRRIIVPLQTDFICPVNSLGEPPGLPLSRITHSDGRLFTDGTGYQQIINDIFIMGAAALNATTLSLNYPQGFTARAGQWFSIDHKSKGPRAYRIIAILQKITGGNDVVVQIQPALREATVPSQPLEFWRPRGTFRLKPGSNDAWRYVIPGVTGMVDVELVEALP